MSSPEILGKRALRKPNLLHEKGEYFVYRVEDKNGKGPFKPDAMNFNSDRSWVGKKRKLFYIRPDQDFDFVQLHAIGWFRQPGAYKFGCKSVEQLLKWFSPEELKRLKKLGFSIKRKRAKAVLYSDNQCMYLPAEA